MAIFDKTTERFLCECGCSEEVSDPLNSFRCGHNLRVCNPMWNEEVRDRHSEVMSGRFLGEEHRKAISRGLRQAYEDNLELAEKKSNRDIFLSDEARKNISEGARQAYIDDSTLATRHGEANLGKLKFLDEETCKAISEGVKRAYREDPTYAVRNAEAHWKGGMWGDCGYGWGAIKDLIRARDNRVCQGCGQVWDLEVHHIDGYSFNTDEKNLITVCHSCNMKASSRYEEEYWFDFYTNRIKEIYSLEEVS